MVGMVLQPAIEPERLVDAARAADDAGVPEVWLWEDCFLAGGIAQAAMILASTPRIRVGIGVLPMPMRTVAVTAMELATLGRAHPGRLVPGLGHGVQSWMDQIGARVASPLTLMREYVPALRSLLAGETVTTSGRYVSLDAVALDHPPREPMRVLAAGEGPKTLRLTGEVADGTIVPAGYDVERMRRVVDEIDAPGPDHEIVLYLRASFDHGVDAVADAVRAYAAVGVTTTVLQPAPDEPDLAGFAARTAEVHAAAG
jgi:alkanesulfonate monooxygenase SsuD/methylene tetrahydromethanopterin reductase-like flavin-dependent oxidoreductase (luciferase family)